MIHDFIHYPPDIGYHLAGDLRESEFGNSYVMSSTDQAAINNWPVIKNENGQSLLRYYLLLLVQEQYESTGLDYGAEHLRQFAVNGLETAILSAGQVKQWTSGHMEGT